MDERPIPHAVRRFILENLHSVEQLEVLLHVRKFCDRDWDAAGVTAELRTNVVSVAKRLEDLTARRFLSRHDHDGHPVYRYAAPDGHREAIQSLAHYYATHSIKIIELIYSRPADAVRTFADAFRLRGDGDNS